MHTTFNGSVQVGDSLGVALVRGTRLGLLGLGLLLLAGNGCWAEFPDSRFELDARGPDIFDPDVRERDLALPIDVGPLEGGADLGADTKMDAGTEGLPLDLGSDRGDGLAGDLPAGDLPQSDLPVGDLPADDLPADDLPIGDLPGADQLSPDLPAVDLLVDSLACTPGAFIACAGKLLQRCNTTGDGIVTTSCGSANCSPSLQRCDACDPAAPATCQGQNVQSCSSDGLFVTTTCSLGCLGGGCCTDVDQDGAACDDCDDNDKNVFPTQTAYFDRQRKSGGYDYNCTQSDEPEFPALVICAGSGSNCAGQGWVGEVPACGQPGQFATCQFSKGSCAAPSPATKKQTCR